MTTVVHCDRCNSVIPEGSLHIVGGVGYLTATHPQTNKEHAYAELCQDCYMKLNLWLSGADTLLAGLDLMIREGDQMAEGNNA